MDVRDCRTVHRLPSSISRRLAERRPGSIGHITLRGKCAGARSAGKPHAACDVAGAGNGLTVRLVRHSHRKRGETDRPRLRSTAPALDPTAIVVRVVRGAARFWGNHQAPPQCLGRCEVVPRANGEHGDPYRNGKTSHPYASPFQTGRRVGMMRSQPVGLRPPENQWPTEKSFRPERSRPRRRNKARLP